MLVASRVLTQPPWRNRLARSAVNRKVGGSIPPGGEIYLFSFFICFFFVFIFIIYLIYS